MAQWTEHLTSVAVVLGSKPDPASPKIRKELVTQSINSAMEVLESIKGAVSRDILDFSSFMHQPTLIRPLKLTG